MNSEMLIRDYKPEDYPQVEALWKETDIYTVDRGDTPQIILRCNDAGGRFLVMEDSSDGSVAGTSWMSWDGRRVFLHHFAIRPSLQSRGYGRSLALESLAFARKLNCPMKLEVHQDNTAAVKLYRNLGFQVFEDYDTYMIIDP